jgi:hypothetical protein
MTQPKFIFRLAVLCAVLVSFWAMPLLSSAKSQANSITITNNSNREIRHVYFSPVDSDNWGPDQFSENAALHTGESATLNISCDQSQVKVIAEDKDGCFSYNTVSCSGNAVWTITNDTAPDCGN